MRCIPNIRYGTENYPETVARRLWAVNMTSWLVAVATALFAVKRPTDPDRLTVPTAICAAAIPLLHRFGPLAAPLALMLLIYAHACRVILTVGSGDGIFLLYVTGAPLSIMLFGLDRGRHHAGSPRALPQRRLHVASTRWSSVTGWKRSRPAATPTWWRAACPIRCRIMPDGLPISRSTFAMR